jgi:hypothetical protein
VLTVPTDRRDSELRRRMSDGLVPASARGSATTSHLPSNKVDLRGSRSAAGYVVDNYRARCEDDLLHPSERWDADTTSRRMELQVGRDLQFIRINGTVVGGSPAC